MYLHSDRQDYRLQIGNTVYISWTNCCLHVPKCAYLCSGSRILCTHWDSSSKGSKMNLDMCLHSDRWVYRLHV